MKTIQEIDQNKFRVPISELKPGDNYKNVMEESIRKLKVSLMEDGQLMPILVDARKEHQGEILGGNHQYFAIKQLIEEEKWPYGDMVWVEPALPGNDLHAKVLALKHNTQYDLPDSQKLAEWAGDLIDSDYFLANIPIMTSDDYKEITMLDIFDQYGPDDSDVVEDEAPEIDDSDPISKLGEVYQLGRHRLMCGDSTNIEHVEKLMNGQKADMVFTDPPYGIDLDTDWTDANKQDYKGFKKIGGAYSKVIGDDKEYNPLHIFEMFGYVKEIFLWGANYYADKLPHRETWFVWDKRENEGGGNLTRFGSEFEICWSREKHRQEIIRKIWAGLFGTETQDVRKRVHPTQKPIELCSWFIEKFSDKDNIIIDLFGGSGSTLIACEQLDRTCYMMELDPKYCDVIRKRYAKFIDKEDSWELVTPAIYNNE